MNKDFIYEEQKQLIEMWKNKYYEQKEKVEQLEKDNYDLDKENQILFESNLKLENNRDKAIEFIEEIISSTKGVINDYSYNKEHNKQLIELLNEDVEMYKNILNLLKGDSDE